MILCVSGYFDRLLHLASFPPVGTVTDNFEGLEEQMAVFQSLRIPHFCANSEAGVSESTQCQRSLWPQEIPGPAGCEKAKVCSYHTKLTVLCTIISNN